MVEKMKVPRKEILQVEVKEEEKNVDVEQEVVVADDVFCLIFRFKTKLEWK